MKNKNLIIVLVAILVVAIIGTVLAVTLTNKNKDKDKDKMEGELLKEGNFTYLVGESEVHITAFENNESTKDVTIPDTYKDKPITTIAGGAFKDDAVIETIKLGDNLVSIGDNAFEGCQTLSTISMPKVVSIGNAAFKDCKALKNVTFPTTLKSIGSFAFENTRSLYNMQFNYNDKKEPISVLESVGEYAFKNSNIKRIIVPASLKVISKRAFSMAQSVDDVIFYEGVEEIGEEAFFDSFYYGKIRTFDASRVLEDASSPDPLEQLSKVNEFPKSLKVIGDRAFMRTSSSSNGIRINSIIFSENLEKIGHSAFKNSYIEGMSFANPDTKLSDYSFSLISYNGVKVTLPANMTSIPRGLFYGSRLYGNVVIPANVEEIGIAAFSGSNYNYTLVLDQSKAKNSYKYLSIGGFSGLLSADGKVLYSVISGGDVVVPDSIEVVEAYAFSRPRSSTNEMQVDMGVNVKTIKANAFTDSNIYRLHLAHMTANSIAIDKDAFKNEVFVDGDARDYTIILKKESQMFDVLKKQFEGTNVSIQEEAKIEGNKEI